MSKKNIWYYIQGNIRNFLYYNCDYFLYSHIKEQISYRIKSMDRECYFRGSCVLCGCETVALQMANKSCNKPCYPPMVNKKTWNFWKSRPTHQIDVGSNHVFWGLDVKNKKFILNE